MDFIYVVVEYGGHWDDEYSHIRKGFAREEDAIKFKTKLEDGELLRAALQERVSAWYNEWLIENPEPVMVWHDLPRGPGTIEEVQQRTEAFGQAEQARFEIHIEKETQHRQAWFARYLELSAEYGFEPLDELDQGITGVLEPNNKRFEVSTLPFQD